MSGRCAKLLRAKATGFDPRRLLGDGLRRSRRSHSRRCRVPADGVIDFVESFTRGAFHCDALCSDAPQEHSAGFGLKLKEIRTAEECRSSFIFVFQRFAILAEEMGGIVGIIERQTEHQRIGLRFGVLEYSVAVALPRWGEQFRAIFVEQLLQNLVYSEFPHGVFFQQLPVGWD